MVSISSAMRSISTRSEISLGDPSGPGIAHNRYWFNNLWSHDYGVYISLAGYYTVVVTAGRKYGSRFSSIQGVSILRRTLTVQF